MEKSDLMRDLLKFLSFRKKENKSLKQNNQEPPGEKNNKIEDHIFESNQKFETIRKKIVKIKN